MGAGPSTPVVRCMNTDEAVKGLPRVVRATGLEGQLDLTQPDFGQTENKNLSAMNSVTTKFPDIEKAGAGKSPGGMRTTKAVANGTGSPAKRPTAFLNLPRASTLSVKYDGLSSNKALGARKLEVQGQEGNVSKNNTSEPRVGGIDSNQLSAPPKLHTTGLDAADNLPFAVSVKVEKVTTGAEAAGGENQTNQDQQKDAELKDQSETASTSEDGLPVEVPEKKVTAKKTAEEIAEKFETGLKKVQAKCDLLLTVKPRDLEQEDAPYTHDFRQCVVVLSNTYFYFKIGEAPRAEILRYRSCVSEYLCQSHVLNTILDSLADGLKRWDFFDESGHFLKDFWFPTKSMLVILLNYSDFVDSIKFSIAEHKELVPQIVATLEKVREGHMSKTLSTEQERMVRICLGILHNAGSLEENVPRLREFDIIPFLLTYIDSPLAAIRLASIATLADLVNESEAELLSTHPRIFTFILHKLERALKMESHRDVGWSVEELLRAVRQLARNDANKAILVDKGCLPILLGSIRVGNEEELQEALDCLWILSFDDTNKSKMVDEPGLVQAVSEKYRAVSGRAGHSCHGILWSLRESLQKLEEFRDIACEILSLKSQATPKIESKAVVEDVDEMSKATLFPGHVMISYQWANQEVIKRICSELRTHGIPVWIDIDYMGGSTLQAMAQAVEDSFAVIIAMSQKYKDSPNTRAEAEYTFQQRKPIVPLIMQNGYRPDGWLGLILGSKLFYDFSGKYSFESRMEGLLKAVIAVARRKGAGDVLDGVDQPLVATKAGAVTLTSPAVPSVHAPVMHRQPAVLLDEETIRSWSREDVSKWLHKFQLENSGLQDLDGEDIVFMHNLKHEAPEFFYRCLDKKLKITSVHKLSRASKAFRNLSSQT